MGVLVDMPPFTEVGLVQYGHNYSDLVDTFLPCFTSVPAGIGVNKGVGASIISMTAAFGVGLQAHATLFMRALAYGTQNQSLRFASPTETSWTGISLKSNGDNTYWYLNVFTPDGSYTSVWLHININDQSSLNDWVIDLYMRVTAYDLGTQKATIHYWGTASRISSPQETIPFDIELPNVNVAGIADISGNIRVQAGELRDWVVSGSYYNGISLFKVETGPPPVADFSATPLSGVAPLTVQLTDQSTGG